MKRIDIEACGGPRKRRGRKGVKLELRAGFVDLVPPTDLPKDTRPLRMLAVRVLEPEPPKGKEPLDWLLLTTEGDPTEQNALRIAEWYEKRWLIEEYFAAVKTGTRIKDRRLNAADDLRRCLAFDAVTACTVMSVERLARGARRTRWREQPSMWTRSMSSPCTWPSRTIENSATRQTRNRQSQTSQSTPPASPDSSRQGDSPYRARQIRSPDFFLYLH